MSTGIGSLPPGKEPSSQQLLPKEHAVAINITVDSVEILDEEDNGVPEVSKSIEKNPVTPYVLNIDFFSRSVVPLSISLAVSSGQSPSYAEIVRSFSGLSVFSVLEHVYNDAPSHTLPCGDSNTTGSLLLDKLHGDTLHLQILRGKDCVASSSGDGHRDQSGSVFMHAIAPVSVNEELVANPLRSSLNYINYRKLDWELSATRLVGVPLHEVSSITGPKIKAKVVLYIELLCYDPPAVSGLTVVQTEEEEEEEEEEGQTSKENSFTIDYKLLRHRSLYDEIMSANDAKHVGIDEGTQVSNNPALDSRYEAAQTYFQTAKSQFSVHVEEGTSGYDTTGYSDGEFDDDDEGDGQPARFAEPVTPADDAVSSAPSAASGSSDADAEITAFVDFVTSISSMQRAVPKPQAPAESPEPSPLPKMTVKPHAFANYAKHLSRQKLLKRKSMHGKGNTGIITNKTVNKYAYDKHNNVQVIAPDDAPPPVYSSAEWHGVHEGTTALQLSASFDRSARSKGATVSSSVDTKSRVSVSRSPVAAAARGKPWKSSSSSVAAADRPYDLDLDYYYHNRFPPKRRDGTPAGGGGANSGKRAADNDTVISQRPLQHNVLSDYYNSIEDPRMSLVSQLTDASAFAGSHTLGASARCRPGHYSGSGAPGVAGRGHRTAVRPSLSASGCYRPSSVDAVRGSSRAGAGARQANSSRRPLTAAEIDMATTNSAPYHTTTTSYVNSTTDVGPRSANPIDWQDNTAEQVFEQQHLYQPPHEPSMNLFLGLEDAEARGLAVMDEDRGEVTPRAASDSATEPSEYDSVVTGSVAYATPLLLKPRVSKVRVVTKI